MALRWREEAESRALVSSVPLLGKRGPSVDRFGVEAGLWQRRRREWSDVAALTWGDGRDGGTLAVCLYGDPWVKRLSMAAWAWEVSWGTCRELLEEVRPFVERVGGRVENRDEAATHWWHLQPEAKRPLS